MMTEQRGNRRLPANLEVTLDYAPLGLIRAKANNISLSGMFVEMPATSLVRVDVPVHIGFRVKGRGIYQLNASVVRVSHNGMGLKFQNNTTEVLEAITGMMQHH